MTNEVLTFIDFRIQDHLMEEKSLKGYPFVINNSSDPPYGQEEILLRNGYNSYLFNQTIRMPTYVKDSVLITVKVGKYDLSIRTLRLKLRLKNNVDFKISNTGLNEKL